MFVAMIFSLTMTSYAAGGVRGNLNGSVITAKGAPVVGASVELVSPSGIYKSETDARGSFRFIGVPTDTYALFLSKKGFQPRSIQGVTIIGGGTVALGALTMKTGLKTIATVQSVAANSSFHPTQTQDTYSVSGQRVQQALGNKYSNNEDSLVLSAPGVVKTYDSTNGNGISVRGSLAVELGYQYDGVPFSAPFFDENGSQGFINGINGGSGGGLQIVSGAGDATQGNVGGGIINTIVPRGTFPAAGHADFEAGSPYYNHTLNLNYAAATDNGHFSNYASFSASRYVPNNGPVNVPSANLATGASYNPYFGTSYERHNDFVDNMVFRFGKNNHESFQILGRVAFTQQYGNYGGLTGLTYFQNPNAPGNNNLFTQFDSGFGANNSYIASLMPTLPYAPSNPAAPVLSPELVNNAPLNFVKLGYTNSLNSRTFLSLAYYNWGLFTGGSNYTTYQQNGVATGWAVYGGTRSGFIASITRAIGDSNTLTLEGSYEHAHPYWDGQQPGYSLLALDPSAVYGPGVTFGGPLSPNSGDFALPATPGQPVNPTTNPCNVTGGCYIYSQLLAAGKWTGTMPQIPTFGINYHGTTQQIWGVGLRDQWQLGNRLNLDFGARIDGEQNKFGPTPYAGISTTPSDVAPNKVGNAFIRPRAFEPRLAFSYRINNNNALRFSYGRSVEFFFGQTLGTPFNVTGVNPLLAGIPAKSGAAPYCGSGTNTQGGPGYSLNTNMPKAAANFGAPAYFFPCSSYAQEFAWFLDQNLDAPDLGGFGPPTYSDFDLAWSHQFTKGRLNGWATRLTAYTRRGFNVEQNVYLLAGPPNPITGQSSASVFTTLANGNEKTFGLEGELTTPDVHPGQHGLSGFLTVNYINELLNTPPVAGSSNLPVLQQQLLQTGTLFKAGFVPPLSAVLGLTYHFKSGMTITPSLFANDGYPFGVGRTSIGYVNGTLLSIPETNYGPNLPFAGQGQPGQAYNASYYVDPQVPGSILNPNIAASRGYAEPALAGNKNSPAQFFLNLDIEAPVSKTSTIGVQIFNLTNNNYNVPVVNTQYQPVANGVAGPGTGQLATANPLGSSYTIGSGNEYYPGGSTLPFLNSYGLGTSWNVYFRTRI
uniref:TonB-dependent receptor-like beta-barrel domain-containing protein n=1 Tax=mine drainage metagenome TaxID=410659 RepID=E6Q556_9ZZZZ